jgi:hypothetical protein
MKQKSIETKKSMHPSASPNYYGQPTSDGKFGLIGCFHQFIEVHLCNC